MTRDGQAKSQSKFVRELADRLQKDIEARAGTISGVQGMDKYTQLQYDIKRIRRELLELSKMIAPHWREYVVIDMRFARKLRRKEKHTLRCCGQKMTYKNGYGYVCEICGKAKKVEK